MALRSHPQAKGSGTSTQQNPVVGTPMMYPDGSGIWRPFDYQTINVLSQPKIYDSNGNPIYSYVDAHNGNATGQLFITNGILQIIDSTTYTESYASLAGGCIAASSTSSGVKTVTISTFDMANLNQPSYLRIKGIRIYGKGFDPTNFYFTLNLFQNTVLSGTYTPSTFNMIADLPSMVGGVQFARTGAIVGTVGNTYGFSQLSSLDIAIPLTWDAGATAFKYVLSCSGANSAINGNKFFVAFDVMLG